jgi:hypothetical protein
VIEVSTLQVAHREGPHRSLMKGGRDGPPAIAGFPSLVYIGRGESLVLEVLHIYDHQLMAWRGVKQPNQTLQDDVRPHTPAFRPNQGPGPGPIGVGPRLGLRNANGTDSPVPAPAGMLHRLVAVSPLVSPCGGSTRAGDEPRSGYRIAPASQGLRLTEGGMISHTDPSPITGAS